MVASIIICVLKLTSTVSVCVEGYETVLGWEGVGESAFIRECIEYQPDTGQFRVFKDGLYVIISNLAFVGPVGVSDIYGQRVKRSRFPEAVLVNLQQGATGNHSRVSGSAPVHNSMAAGVRRLRANQLIYVEAKPARRLSRGNEYSYFSLIKLQDSPN